MKKIILLIISIILNILSCNGINDLYDKVDGQDASYKIVVADSTIGGLIWISEDSGETWRQTGPGGEGWGLVSSSEDGSKIVAAPLTSIDTIYNSTDGGKSWVSRSIVHGTSVNWSTLVSSSDGSICFAACSFPAEDIFKSSDYGVTWSNIGYPAGSKLWGNCVSSPDGRRLETVESGGTNMYTWTLVFNGTSWNSTPKNIVAPNQYNCIASSSDGRRLIAASHGNYIYISSDFGASWTVQLIPGLAYWRSVTSSMDGMNLAAADNYNFNEPGGYIWITHDGGVNWKRCDGPGQRVWRKIAASPDGKFIAAGCQVGGSAGYIYTSDDAGETWKERRGIHVVGNGIAVSVKK